MQNNHIFTVQISEKHPVINFIRASLWVTSTDARANYWINNVKIARSKLIPNSFSIINITDAKTQHSNIIKRFSYNFLKFPKTIISSICISSEKRVSCLLQRRATPILCVIIYQVMKPHGIDILTYKTFAFYVRVTSDAGL